MPSDSGAERIRKPSWLKVGLAAGRRSKTDMAGVRAITARLNLNTVCEHSGCPNLFECYSHGIATFLILGGTCTRACGFCRVRARSGVSTSPAPVEEGEPDRVAEATAQMKLRHVVVTSVTRDDLPDGGAASFANTVASIRRRSPGTTVEVLIPDLLGDPAALSTVFDSRPDVLSHNIETVPRLYPSVRDQGSYVRSLGVLASARSALPATCAVKSGLMVGLGERVGEVKAAADVLLRTGCTSITVGQYLQPSRAHLEVERYWHPDEFRQLADELTKMGFERVVCEPLARSSYHADPSTTC